MMTEQFEFDEKIRPCLFCPPKDWPLFMWAKMNFKIFLLGENMKKMSPGFHPESRNPALWQTQSGVSEKKPKTASGSVGEYPYPVA